MDVDGSRPRVRNTGRDPGHPENHLNPGLGNDFSNAGCKSLPAVIGFRTMEEQERLSAIITQKVKRDLRSFYLFRHPALHGDDRAMRTVVNEVFSIKVCNMRCGKGTKHLLNSHSAGSARIHRAVEIRHQNSRASVGSLVIIPMSLGFGHVPLLRCQTRPQWALLIVKLHCLHPSSAVYPTIAPRAYHRNLGSRYGKIERQTFSTERSRCLTQLAPQIT